LVGVFVIVPRIEVVEIAALAGYDLVVIDQEHGVATVTELPALILAAHGAGVFAVVRVPDERPHPIGAALDLGADGVLVPNVTSAATARSVVASARFPPDGTRGANPYVRAGAYATQANFFRTADRGAACIAMIERPDGVAAAEDIIAVPGLDAAFFGPVDLSMALGLAGDTEHPRVAESIRAGIAVGRRSGTAMGVFAANPASARSWIKEGARLAVLSVDTALMFRGFKDARTEVGSSD
jgi:2-keto-3-deoxy-L-rhamnonate aldolase RhmA